MGGKVTLPIPSLGQYHQLSDKYQLTAWAEKQGIRLPTQSSFPTVFGERNRSDRRMAGGGEAGAITPQVDGAWKKRRVVCHDQHELRRLYHEVWYLAWPSLIQQRIAVKAGCFGLFDCGKRWLFSHRRLRERPPSGG